MARRLGAAVRRSAARLALPRWRPWATTTPTLCPPSGGLTFGLRRTEILSAQVNGATLLVLAGVIAFESVGRLLDPPDIAAAPVIVVGVLGGAANGVAAWALSRAARQSLTSAARPSTCWPTCAVPGVVEVHDLHVWEITSGFPALAAHVLVAPGQDCHAARRTLESVLHDRFALEHTTLQVDQAPREAALLDIAPLRPR